MPRTSSRERLIRAAAELFAAQGVRETTTRQIAERAELNEVTLFRQFGNKHALMLAVIKESGLFAALEESTDPSSAGGGAVRTRFAHLADDCLQAFAQLPELLLSAVVEAERDAAEERIAVGRSLEGVNRSLANRLEAALGERTGGQDLFKIATLLNTLLLGRAVSAYAGAPQTPWVEREDFLASVVELFFCGVFDKTSALQTVNDLDGELVHRILDGAKKSGAQDFALVYVLFAAGLSAEEVSTLARTDQVFDKDRALLQVANRQVPLNRQILGRRYGSYNNNPLTRWLKTRRDGCQAVFIDEIGKPMTPEGVRFRWSVCTRELVTTGAAPPALEQACETWCVEMLTRGANLETLALLTGQPPELLQPFARRAQEKLALETALKLDR
ncbi:TetR family transcriptional regulator [Gloeobacter violaceus]|uniref:Gll2867 protein n=1 Tax=Gloeobacter violaceus (strain ATCC 29082 / PCC 7421) TaxID=251221 RepID=Q7NCV9_GLOVI|nr:TetR family transcriptional regulator [Gloeobacter violaceus]BAC90808.1 gll2867 [Gloeobacter violaceus PCC 7421]